MTAIAETNTAFTESGVNAQLNLVHTYRDDNYDENDTGTNNDFVRAINDITNRDDGQFESPDVHSERKDVSCLLVCEMDIPIPLVQPSH